ncbi:ABC transporter permease [Candidatus Dojkabacteria bacterium]|nr:ABC transporter permease [Candidatus Dojkabacteria bacterium]
MKNILLVIKKELKDYYISPIAYVVISAFVVLITLKFITSVFVDNVADMRNIFYEWEFPDLPPMPILLILVIPALTMRSWAEERREGTLEVISTLPISNIGLIVAKFISCFLFTTFMLLLTLPIPITLNILGNPDNGVIIAGYLGLILLSASYISIGQFVSINTRNQIISFILSFVLITMLYIFGEIQFLQYVPSSLRFLFGSLGLGSHLRSIAKGVLDSRDILYYISIIALLFYFTYRSFQRIKRTGE